MLAHADAAPARRSLAIAAASSDPDRGFLLWYLGLIPHWLGPESPVERRLLLRTHQWIVDRVLAPDARLADVVEDVLPAGALVSILTELAGEEDPERWRQFIQVVVANLRHALLLPVARRNEAWLRWLFLIPYSARPRLAAVNRDR
jgi:hypothetical protein